MNTIMKQINKYLEENEYDKIIEFLLLESEKFKNKGDDEDLIISDVLAEWACILSKGIERINIKELIEKSERNLKNKKELENKIKENNIKLKNNIKSLDDFFLWFDNNVIQASSKRKYPRTFSSHSITKDKRYSIRKVFKMIGNGQDVDFDDFSLLMIEQLDNFKNLHREPIYNEENYKFNSFCVRRGMYLDYIDKEKQIEIMKKNISEIKLIKEEEFFLISKLNEIHEEINNEDYLCSISSNCIKHMVDEFDKLGIKYS